MRLGPRDESLAPSAAAAPSSNTGSGSGRCSRVQHVAGSPRRQATLIWLLLLLSAHSGAGGPVLTQRGGRDVVVVGHSSGSGSSSGEFVGPQPPSPSPPSPSPPPLPRILLPLSNLHGGGSSDEAYTAPIPAGGDPTTLLLGWNCSANPATTATVTCWVQGPDNTLSKHSSPWGTGSGPAGGGASGVTITGTGPADGVALDPSHQLTLSYNMALTLRGIAVDNVTLTAPAAQLASAPASAANLNLGGLTLINGATLTLDTVTLYLARCTDWTALRASVCGGNGGDVLFPGRARYENHTISVVQTSSLVAGISWTNVMLPEPAGGCAPLTLGSGATKGANTTVDANVTCEVREMSPFMSTGPGEMMLDTITELQKTTNRTTLFLTGSITLPADIASVPVLQNSVTLIGLPNAITSPPLASIVLDFNLAPHAFNLTAAGNLAFQDLVLVNMPASPAHYPLGLMTCLFWNVDAPGAVQIPLSNVTLLLPDDEVQYVSAIMLQRGWTNSSWMGQVTGAAWSNVTGVQSCVGSSSGSCVNLTTISSDGSWWLAVGGASSPLASEQRQILSTGLVNGIVMPWEETQTTFPLPAIMSLPLPSVPLATFSLTPLPFTNLWATSLGSSNSPSNSPATNTSFPACNHFIMTQNAAISANNTNASTGVVMTVPSVLVGDPVVHQTLAQGNAASTAAAPRVLDILGVGSVQQASGSGSWACISPLLSIGPCGTGGSSGTVPATDCYLVLRSVTLINLLPACPSSLRDALLAPLANFTSLLWMFGGLDRSRIDDGNMQQSRVVLEHVTLVVSPRELQVVRTVVRNVTGTASGSGTDMGRVEPQAGALLLQQLEGLAFLSASQRPILSDPDLNCLLLPSWVDASTPSSQLPGDITFPTLTWFGIEGVSVTLTAVVPPLGPNLALLPPETVLNIWVVPDDSSGNGSGGAPYGSGPGGSWSPHRPNDSFSPVDWSPTSPGWKHTAWEVALVSVAAGLGVILLLAGAGWVGWTVANRRRQRASEMGKGPSTGTSGSSAAGDGDAEGGGAGGGGGGGGAAGLRVKLPGGSMDSTNPEALSGSDTSLSMNIGASHQHVMLHLESGFMAGELDVEAAAAAWRQRRFDDSAADRTATTTATGTTLSTPTGLARVTSVGVGSRGRGAGGSSIAGSEAAAAAAAAAAALGLRRRNTETFLAEVFADESFATGGLAAGGASGDAASAALAAAAGNWGLLGQPRTSTMPFSVEEDEGVDGYPGHISAAAAAAAAATALLNPQQQMQRRMDALKCELGGGGAQWVVQGQIGKGAFGVVYKGVWRGLEVAIKRILFQVLTHQGDDENSRRTALREAAINATLDHPHIVSTYTYDMQQLGGGGGDRGSGSGLTDWQMHIIQEYCNGGSLFDAIFERRFHRKKDAAAAAAAAAAGEDATTATAAAETAAEAADPSAKSGGSSLAQKLQPGYVPAAGAAEAAPGGSLGGAAEPGSGSAAGAVSGGGGALAAAAESADWAQILSVAWQVASGCDYIHSKNIIHGDLKPDNVLLKLGPSGSTSGDSCVAKVADFGMSMNMSATMSHVSGVRHGTPLYIAPEILRSGKASKAADVYSFGVLMWELYHGTLAWQHLMQVCGPPVHRKPPAFFPGLFTYAPGCPLPGYAALGARCIAEDPAARPTFEEVCLELEALQAQLLEGGAMGATAAAADGVRRQSSGSGAGQAEPGTPPLLPSPQAKPGAAAAAVAAAAAAVAAPVAAVALQPPPPPLLLAPLPKRAPPPPVLLRAVPLQQQPATAGAAMATAGARSPSPSPLLMPRVAKLLAEHQDGRAGATAGSDGALGVVPGRKGTEELMAEIFGEEGLQPSGSAGPEGADGALSTDAAVDSAIDSRATVV